MSQSRPKEEAPLTRFGMGLSRRYIRNSSVVVGLVYPAWHLLAPEGARDPWVVYWLIGAFFVSVGLLASVASVPEERVRRLFHFFPWPVTAQFFVLAHLNGMQSFYAVGSALAVLSTATQLRSITGVVTYGAFVTALGGALYLLEPDPLKIAYWSVLIPVLLLTAHRLSVQHDAAAAVGAQQAELERRVAERTVELTRAYEQLQGEMEERELLQEQLRLSQKMQAVGQLAGGIAHDFNNLLTVIGSYGEFILARSQDPSVRRDVAEMIRAGTKASHLTAGLLAFARGGVTHPVVVDLKEIVHDSEGMIGSVAGEDVEASVEQEDVSLRIRIDRNQLDQALLNLVLNARDAMPEGGKLTVATSCRSTRDAESNGIAACPDGGDFAVLSVSDTGVGMDPETQSRAFEPFFTTKGPDRGTGLGLAMVYGIVQQAGGELRLISEPGHGACFELWFPRLDLPTEPLQAARSRVQPNAEGECILVVEDDADIRQVLRRALGGAGYTVLDAEDGEAALSLLGETKLDVQLVLTDVVMPRMSGFDLAERVAALRPSLPILFMSGQLNHPSRQDRELPPNTLLLAKPFTPADLLDRVAQALTLREPTQR